MKQQSQPKPKIKFFTDEDHKNLFIFGNKMSNYARSGKPILTQVNLRRRRK
jgi:hypothetical protein